MQMPSDIEIMAEYRKIATIELETRYERQALVYAKRKLRRIIERYGDEDGKRYSAKYAAILMAEAVSEGMLDAAAYRPEGAAKRQQERGTSLTPSQIVLSLVRLRGIKATSRPEKETARHEVSQRHYNAFTPVCQ